MQQQQRIGAGAGAGALVALALPLLQLCATCVKLRHLLFDCLRHLHHTPNHTPNVSVERIAGKKKGTSREG